MHASVQPSRALDAFIVDRRVRTYRGIGAPEYCLPRKHGCGTLVRSPVVRDAIPQVLDMNSQIGGLHVGVGGADPSRKVASAASGVIFLICT